MKKILFCFAFIVAIATGCTKEEPKTTFSFTAIDGIIASSTNLLHESDYYNVAFDVVFSEYGGGHRISFQSIDGAIDGKKYTFEANPNTEYITVRFDLTGEHDRYDDFEYTNYIANVILLTKGQNTEITLGPETMVSKTEPK